MRLLRILLVTLLTSLAATQPMNFVLNGDFSSAGVSLANPRKKYTSNILGWYGVNYQIAIASIYTQNWWAELPVVVIGLESIYQSVVLRVTAVYEISFMWCAIANADLGASTISVTWNQRPIFNGQSSSYYPTIEKFMINSHAGINQLQFKGGNSGIIISKVSITHRSAIINGQLNYPPLVLNPTTGSLVTTQQFGILGWESPIVQLVPGSNFNSNWRGVVIDTSVSQVFTQTFRTLPLGRVYSLTFQWASRYGSGFDPRAQQVSTYWNRKMVKVLYSTHGAIHSQHFQVFAFQGINNLTFMTKAANPPITYGIALTNFKLVPKL